GGSGGGGGSVRDMHPFSVLSHEDAENQRGDDGGGGGGGGGGAFQILTAGDLVVSGVISAVGGNGGVGNSSAGGNGGGGSGGTIVLSARGQIRIEEGAYISVLGGRGGGEPFDTDRNDALGECLQLERPPTTEIELGGRGGHGQILFESGDGMLGKSGRVLPEEMRSNVRVISGGDN
ncbi:MAG: hypothetical protein AAF517_20150, partial [Planctomycetota bacterium]